MDKNAKLLNEIYQNAEMGQVAIDKVIEDVENQELKGILVEQKKQYDDIKNVSNQKMCELGIERNGLQKMTKHITNVMVGMKTAVDKSGSHIADMMVKGNNMGIIDITKAINDSGEEVEQDILDLANRLVQFEQQSIDQMKSYL